MMFDIGSTTIGGENTVVIAEAGVNHLGRLDYAEELIKSAARAGADIIKFQTYKASKLTTQNAPRFWSWEGERDESGSQFDSYSLLDSFEREQYQQLIQMCNENGIEFMSTPFDVDSADMLVEIGMKGFKVASCDLTNLPFLKHLAAKQLPILLSTGASTVEEIKTAVDVIKQEGNRKICIMQCTLCYPTENKDANLAALKDIERHFPDFVLGLSDHTLGTIIPAASILYGAKVIEKHYTFDKSLPYSADHWLSLDEPELKTLVSQIKVLQEARGNDKKTRLECEMPAFKFARRSIVATADIPEGALIEAGMLDMKRPGTGLPAVYLDRVIGRRARRDIKFDDILSLDDVD